MNGNPEPAAPAAPVPPAPPRTGLAIASLVLGIVATVLSFLLIGGVAGLVGLLLGLMVIARRRQPRAMAWCGVGLSIFGIVASIGFGSLYYVVYKHFRELASAATGENDLSVWEGVIAPDLSVTTLDGNVIRISELRGKRVLLDFWATWCGPCVKEVPHINRLHQETSRDELVIIGISNESAEKLKSFVERHGVRYLIASKTDLPSPYSDVRAIPTAFFIDTNGVIQSVVTGYQDFDSMRELALSSDYEGERKQPPDQQMSGVLAPTELWSKEFREGTAVAPCQWDGDAAWEIAVLDGPQLRILTADGVEAASFPIPEYLEGVECGRRGTGGVRFLVYRKWGFTVQILNSSGVELFTIPTTVAINGAHWVDLDGDGTEEIIVGMYGGAGLCAYSAKGRELWKASLGTVWNEAAVDATDERPALIFAMDNKGKVNLFNGAGNLLRTIQPRQKWSAQISATVIGGNRRVQAVTIAEDEAVGFDETGSVSWCIPSPRSAASFHVRTFAHGDLDGDGRPEWVVRAEPHAFMFVTADGQVFSALKGTQPIHDFAVIPSADGPDILVTLEAGTLRAFAFR